MTNLLPLVDSCAVPAQLPVYQAVQAYELAYSYRDVPREVDTLLAWCRRHGGRSPRRVLELAAGPGDHALEFAQRGVAATALDAEAAMCDRIRARADQRGLDVRVVHADMAGFELGETVDLAIMMLDSVAHLLDLDRLLENLRATARHLSPGGLYVIEASHPGDFFAGATRAQLEWEVVDGDRRARLRWGGPGDPFDPISQVSMARVRIEYVDGDRPPVVAEQVLAQRCWTATELDAAARLSGCFEVAGRYGSVEPDVPFDEGEAAWRMVYVLRRIAGRELGPPR